MNTKKILLSICFLLIGSSVFAQSKDLAKMYNQLDSLENRILELKRENDAAVLRCIANKNCWDNTSNAQGCRGAYGLSQNGLGEIKTSDGTSPMNYAQRVCECMVGKKHEIEAVETKIKQLERKIELLKDENKQPHNVKK
ncbi:MAG: hypothetical protein LBP85_08680 [Prevotellaceae bacterium]|nr:hypothetical protein [Prevotellaceae bacterium]